MPDELDDTGADRGLAAEPELDAGQGAGGRGEPRSPRVFISYAHEPGEHRKAVRDLWMFLRAHGVDAVLDRPAAERPQDWPLWMGAELRQADFVLVVASPAYRRRAEGRAEPDEGRGVQYEAALIREMLYRDRRTWFPRILPVLLPGRGAEDVPDFLTPYSASTYTVTEISEKGLGPLLRVLLEDPHETMPPLGRRPVLPHVAAASLGQVELRRPLADFTNREPEIVEISLSRPRSCSASSSTASWSRSPGRPGHVTNFTTCSGSTPGNVLRRRSPPPSTGRSPVGPPSGTPPAWQPGCRGPGRTNSRWLRHSSGSWKSV